MSIIVRNKAELSNKYVRFVKWKMYAVKEKFPHLHTAKVSIKKEGNNPTKYYVKVRLGISGHDIVIKDKSFNLWKLLYKIDRDVRRQLAKDRKLKLEAMGRL